MTFRTDNHGRRINFSWNLITICLIIFQVWQWSHYNFSWVAHILVFRLPASQIFHAPTVGSLPSIQKSFKKKEAGYLRILEFIFFSHRQGVYFAGEGISLQMSTKMPAGRSFKWAEIFAALLIKEAESTEIWNQNTSKWGKLMVRKGSWIIESRPLPVVLLCWR